MTSFLPLIVLISAMFLPVAYLHAQQLNDTGIRYGGNYPKTVNQSCTGHILDNPKALDIGSQQDCATGTSASVSKSAQSTFQYKKISSSGEVLATTSESWSCVLDETTGLMWEVKSEDDSLHNVNDKFTWYYSDHKRNAGHIGEWNKDNASCFGYVEGAPRTYCHIEQFTSRVNKQGLCGYTDWRVPTRAEMTSLIHFGQFQPSIETSHFPQTLSTFYWVQEPVPGRNLEAWSVDFEFGSTTPLRKTDLRPVRLVRGHTLGQSGPDKLLASESKVCELDTMQPTSSSTYFRKIDETSYLDVRTQLMWQKCLVGQSGKLCQEGNANTLNWAEALSITEANNGWRLPNIRELASLSELSCSRPALNNELFPTPERAQLWSSSPYLFYDHYSWYFDAEDGVYIYGERTDKRYVRLVKPATTSTH